MTTDLEQRLRDALHEDADRARLANPNGPPVPEARPLTVEPRRQRPSRKLVAAAAAVVLLVSATVAVIQSRDDEPDLNTASLVLDEIHPGATVELPPGPLSPRDDPAVVWTGREMIVWGGSGTGGPLDNGAAFDPITGEWRVIAPAPIDGRSVPQVAWTGSEMLVVGGHRATSDFDDEPMQDGAAYDPSTDSWRLLPDAPNYAGYGARAVWTGDELLVVGGITVMSAAAYSPDTNEWRQLAEPPDLSPRSLVWAGETALMVTEDGDDRTSGASSLVRYDPRADEWQTVDRMDYAYLVAVPDDDGEVASVVALPTELGAPVTVLDRSGQVSGTLPGNPGDPDIYGSEIDATLRSPYTDGLWTGHEALFWIQGLDSPYGEFQRPAPWALDPESGTWRELGEDAPPLGAHLELAGDSGALMGWGPPPSTPGGETSEAPTLGTGIAYRPPGQGDEVRPLESPTGLPAPGVQPGDPSAAEAEVRDAYLKLGETSVPAEDRAPYSERPAVWLDAAHAVTQTQYWGVIQTIQEQVDEVVFDSPTHAVVRFELVADDPIVPRDHIGEAVLVDGHWKMAIATSCELFNLTGVTCNMTLEG